MFDEDREEFQRHPNVMIYDKYPGSCNVVPGFSYYVYLIVDNGKDAMRYTAKMNLDGESSLYFIKEGNHYIVAGCTTISKRTTDDHELDVASVLEETRQTHNSESMMTDTDVDRCALNGVDIVAKMVKGISRTSPEMVGMTDGGLDEPSLLRNQVGIGISRDVPYGRSVLSGEVFLAAATLLSFQGSAKGRCIWAYCLAESSLRQDLGEQFDTTLDRAHRIMKNIGSFFSDTRLDENVVHTRVWNQEFDHMMFFLRARQFTLPSSETLPDKLLVIPSFPQSKYLWVGTSITSTHINRSSIKLEELRRRVKVHNSFASYAFSVEAVDTDVAVAEYVQEVEELKIDRAMQCILEEPGYISSLNNHSSDESSSCNSTDADRDLWDTEGVSSGIVATQREMFTSQHLKDYSNPRNPN